MEWAQSDLERWEERDHDRHIAKSRGGMGGAKTFWAGRCCANQIHCCCIENEQESEIIEAS